jgi:hypothetical protein
MNGKQLFWADGGPVMAKGRKDQELWCCETCGSLRMDKEWCCKQSKRFHVDVGDIIENATTDMFEDATDHVKGLEEFEAACDALNKANAHLVSWEPDYKRMVRVPSGRYTAQ